MDAKHKIMEILHRKHTCKDKGWVEDILQDTMYRHKLVEDMDGWVVFIYVLAL